MRRSTVVAWMIVAFTTGMGGTSYGQAPGEPPAAVDALTADERIHLEAIADGLRTLQFEQAATMAGALLDDPESSEAARAEALRLRAQSWVAVGNGSAAEKDWKSLLQIRPSFVPDTSFVPKKAMDRFRRLQAATVGRLVLRIDPDDAEITLDGRSVQALPEGVAVLAGDRALRVTREGFDPAEKTVRVEPDASGTIEITLVPNARSVIVLSDPDDVEVLVDGGVVGRTSRPPDAGPGGPAVLDLGYLRLGEHRFELRRDCYRPVTLRKSLDVDLLDRSALQIGTVRLEKDLATLSIRGGPEGADLRVGDAPAVRLPTQPLSLCPGTHRVEIRRDERTIRVETVELTGGADEAIDLAPRPNVVRLGRNDDPALAAFLSQVNVMEASGRLSGDPMSRTAWRRLDLPADVDLGVMAVAGGRYALYSPELDQVASIATLSEAEGPRSWTRASWGLRTVDSEVGGPLRVVSATRGAAAGGLQPGDRVIAAGGIALRDSEQFEKILAVASPRAPLELRWETARGRERSGAIRGSETIWLPRPPDDDAAAIVRAAWAASYEGWTLPETMTARADLALLLAHYGHTAAAVERWKTVRWPAREGLGDGTVRYYLGSALAAVGNESEAIAQLREAASSAATVIDDDGPAVAPAATDRLADLGVADGPPSAR